MNGRVRLYAKRLRANVTARQLAALEREAALAGVTVSDVVRRAIDNYLAGLKKHGTAHEVYRFSAGHGSYVVDERITQMRIELDFIQRHL